eukprot:gene5961-6904_t
MSQKIALVTGCSSGIGASLARTLHAQGIKVFASARNLESIRGLEAEGLQIVQLDVVNVPSIETNVFGVMNMCSIVGKQMCEQRSGTIANIGSIVGLLATPFTAHYCASKAAVHSYSDVLRMEVAPFGVKVMVVCPGAIKSEIANNAQPQLEAILNSTRLYSMIKDAIVLRGKASQTNCMSSESFAAGVVAQVLKTSPPAYFAFGPLSRLFTTLCHVPSWITDFILSRRFGLSKLTDLLRSKKI